MFPMLWVPRQVNKEGSNETWRWWPVMAHQICHSSFLHLCRLIVRSEYNLRVIYNLVCIYIYIYITCCINDIYTVYFYIYTKSTTIPIQRINVHYMSTLLEKISSPQNRERSVPSKPRAQTSQRSSWGNGWYTPFKRKLILAFTTWLLIYILPLGCTHTKVLYQVIQYNVKILDIGIYVYIYIFTIEPPLHW